MNIIKDIAKLSEGAALCFVRKWARPVLTIVWTIIISVNCIYLPLKKGEPVDLAGLALLLGAFAPVFICRTVEKIKGVD